MEVNMAKYAYRVPNGTENDRVDASDRHYMVMEHFIAQHLSVEPECMCALRKSQVRVL